jgi:hypothetical protein
MILFLSVFSDSTIIAVLWESLVLFVLFLFKN